MSQAPTPPPTPTPTLLQRAWAVARVLITVGLLALVVLRIVQQWDEVRALRAHPSALDAVGAVVIGLCAYIGLAALFAWALELVGHKRAGHRLFHLRLWLQPYLYKYVPGKVMVAMERVRLGALVGLPGAELVLLLLWESVFLLVGAALVVAVAFSFARVDDRDAVWWIVPSSVGSLVLLLTFPWLLKAAMVLPFLRKRLQNMGSLRFSFAAQSAMVLGYAGVWLCFSLSFLLFCRWFVPVEGPAAASVVFWYVAAYVAGFVSSVTPGGVGVREGILAVGLAPVLGPAEAAALAVAGRIFTTVLEMICTGAGFLIPLPKRRP